MTATRGRISNKNEQGQQDFWVQNLDFPGIPPKYLEYSFIHTLLSMRRSTNSSVASTSDLYKILLQIRLHFTEFGL